MWRHWTGAVCERCWREALDYEPDRDAALALDPNAPDWVVERLARSDDEAVLANVAARGELLRPDVRRRLAQTASPVVQQALAGDGRPLVPAWSLYRSTPRPGVTTATAAATVLAVVAVLVLETRSGPVDSAPSVEQPEVPVAVSSPASTAVAVTAAAVAPAPAMATTPEIEVVASPVVVQTTTPTTIPVTTVPPTTAPPLPTVTTVTTAVVPITLSTTPLPEPPPTSVPAVAPPQAPPAAVEEVLTFDVPFPATVTYVGAYGITEVVLRSPDGTTWQGVTSAEGTGPAGTWTATVTTVGAWAGEFVSRG